MFVGVCACLHTNIPTNNSLTVDFATFFTQAILTDISFKMLRKHHSISVLVHGNLRHGNIGCLQTYKVQCFTRPHMRSSSDVFDYVNNPEEGLKKVCL